VADFLNRAGFRGLLFQNPVSMGGNWRVAPLRAEG
jgi:hypothetical protein